MTYPQFISLDSSNGDPAFPIAISWSMGDGQLKSILIIPDDQWEPWDNNQSSYDTDFLVDHGASCPELLQELVADMESNELFSLDLESDLNLLEMICEACGQDLGFELLPFQLAFESIPSEKLWPELDAAADLRGIDLTESEGRIRALVFLADELTD